MRHTCAAALIAATLILSACTDDGDPPDARSTSTPSGTIETPSPSADPTPTEPPLPDAATKATRAGARAFITYYWDLINYAQVTGDVTALSDLSASTCEGCLGGITAIQSLYNDGGRLEGGSYRVTFTSTSEITSGDGNRFGVEARYSVTSTEQSVIQPDGSVDISEPGSTSYLSYLIWLDDAWRTDVLEAQ